MPRLLSDISSTAAQRAFLIQGDDDRFSITVNAERSIIPAEWEGDIHAGIHASWESMPGLTNDDIGQLLINIGIELRRKGQLTHLDGEKPTV